MLNDFVRIAVIQLAVQFLFFVVNPAENPFFSTIFLQTIGFLLVGVLVYWLIVRNLFEFHAVPPEDSHVEEHFANAARSHVRTGPRDAETSHEGKADDPRAGRTSHDDRGAGPVSVEAEDDGSEGEEGE